MPPNTNDTTDQNTSASTPPAEPDNAGGPPLSSSVDDTVPSTVIPQTDVSAADTSSGSVENPQNNTPVHPDSNASTLSSPPPINESAIPANNRPTLDTITAPVTEKSESLEAEIDRLPDTTAIENPSPDQAPQDTALPTESSLADTAPAEPTPTPPAFPETASESQEPKKQGFFSKFFKHK